MLGLAWLTLRQVQEALKNGRLEEAQRLLDLPSVAGHRRAGELLGRLARGYVERGERCLRHDDSEGAWRNLFSAERLQSGEKATDRLRQALTRLGVAEARALLETGDLGRADEGVARLRQRGVSAVELQVLEDSLRGWLRARDLADRGEFGPAAESAERVRKVLTGNRALEEFAAGLPRRRDAVTERLARLHEAADAGRWREVIELSEQVLSLAPQHAEARALRGRAWKAVQPATVTVAAPPEAERDTARDEALVPRFFLWIDGVGGYLICLGNRLTFGHAALDARVDVPLVADVSRLHATLTRDGEGYVLEAVRPIQVNGQSMTRALLQSGDRVTLGTSCQFQFHLPVPGSTTARVELVSGHRLPLAVEGVLLMADTLVLGPGKAHVSVPDLKDPVVLFRHKDGLGVRHDGALRVNGRKSPGRTLLNGQTVVNGEDIAFAIEPAGKG
jgi:hypothetical protein